MIRWTGLVSVTAVALLMAGCALFSSPAVGEWEGQMSASPQGGVAGAFASGMITAFAGSSAHVSLKSNGTGYLKAMSMPEQQITWKADGDRVLIYGLGESRTTNTTSSPEPESPVVGRLSENKKSLVFDLGPVQYSLVREVR